MSLWLDEHRELIGRARISADTALRRPGDTSAGRVGLALRASQAASPAELRGVGVSSGRLRLVPRLPRLPLSWTPKKSVLHRTISAIRAEIWEAINRILVASARQEKVETGKVARLDSTVTGALMHEPSDSSLLWDAVRVMVRLLKAADALVCGLVWRNHRRAAKKRAREIEYARDRPTRLRHYRELIPGHPGLCRSGRNAVMARLGSDRRCAVAS
jgi:transposase, IS5 family